MVITLPLISTSSITACVIALLVPRVTPSIVPGSMSAVSATNASVVTVPSKNASLNSKELVPKSISLSVEGHVHVRPWVVA